MRILLTVFLFLFSLSVSYPQKTKVPPKNYPSLLWEITGKGLSKPSYLFGTMHVSSKMVFHLSDSFYLGIKNADVVALETNMGTWQEDFSRYDMDSRDLYNYFSGRNNRSAPSDFMTIGTLQFPSYEKMIELALYNSPSIINNFLYRSNSERAADFEEDTYLDLHIYQAGKKWGKKVCGVEDFDQSMQLMKEAYLDASKDKEKNKKSYDYDEDFSYAKMEDAYRTGNLDLLDTINKVNSASAAFDEKFLYKRNEIQAASIDSILRSGSSLFVGVGAAHLPGQRGVIELLRKKGFKLRPIKMTERDSRHKEEVEKIRVPVQFSKQISDDGLFSVSLPGKLYEFDGLFGMARQQQFADMTNGSYYMVTRISTNAVLWGHSEDMVLSKIDSVIYENIPGKILTKQAISRNGFRGIEVVNKTRRGDYQRYNIFVTPFEIIMFKMSGNGEYVKEGKEADQFFNSIELNNYKNEWTKWSPVFGGFEAEFPHTPVTSHGQNWQFMAVDKASGTGFEVIRTDIHNYDFVEEDSFDLNLMEESFAASEYIDKQISRKQIKFKGYPALDVKYKYKDGSIALVRFLIQGTHYYTLISHARSEQPKMSQFLNSFAIKPFVYGSPSRQTDTSLYFTVNTQLPLQKSKKLSLYPENPEGFQNNNDDEAFLEESGLSRDKLVASDSTGEKIYLSFFKPSRYYFDNDKDTSLVKDTTHFRTDKLNWVYRSRKKYELANKTTVLEYVIGDPASSRYVRGKLFNRDGVHHRLETEGDTLTAPSSFITGFFDSFVPSDTVKGTNIKERKSKLYFADYFSADTLLHKRAVKNINRMDFDSSDFGQLKKIIQGLNWNEKKYMDVKKSFVWQLSGVRSNESANYLKDIYYSAGDTIELQYTALEALLGQQTGYAFQVFRDIMVNDPPVLNVGSSGSGYHKPVNYQIYSSVVKYDQDIDYNGSGSFFSSLNDSLELTKTIFKDLLPLINIHDYEQPMMDLMGTLVDSSMIEAKDYENYQSKFLIEARQLMKKQIINEKNKSIEKAQEDEDDKNDYQQDNDDDGNNQLSLYATLLMPFWDKNPSVPLLFNQMLASNDKRLKYTTMLMLLHHKKSVPDSIIRYFASMDDYRYQLYSSLKEYNLFRLFPAQYNTHLELGRSKLLVTNPNRYNKPDSIVFLERQYLKQNGREGYVYFFKYRQKKEENSWRLASVGMVPSDPKQFEFEVKGKYIDEQQYDFTELGNKKIENDEPLKDQIRKMLKKMQYAKRNSAAEYYNDEGRSGLELLRGMNFRD